MEIDPSEPSDQNSPADHELGPKQPNRGRNPSGWSFYLQQPYLAKFSAITCIIFVQDFHIGTTEEVNCRFIY